MKDTLPINPGDASRHTKPHIMVQDNRSETEHTPMTRADESRPSVAEVLPAAFSDMKARNQITLLPEDEEQVPDYALAISMRSNKLPVIPGSALNLEKDMRYLAEQDTIPMMVLKGLNSQQGESTPTMQSEISGAAGGAAIVGIGNIAGSALKFGSNYLLQVGFGATLYGLYSVSLSLITLIASLCTLGFGDTTIRYTAIYQSKQQTRSLNGLIVFCSSVALIMGILGALSILFFSQFFAGLKHEPHMAPLMQMMAPIVPLICTQAVWFGSLQGLKQFKWRVLAERLLVPSVLLVIALLFFFFSPSIFNIALAAILSTAVGTIAGGLFLHRFLTGNVIGGKKNFEFREWMSFSIFNFLTSITEVVLESIDTLLLVSLAVTTLQIGQYNAAIKLSDFISMPLFSLTTMFAPTIAELHSKGEHDKLGTMYKVVNKWTITLSMPIFLVTSLFSQPLLLLSGPSFLDAWPLLVMSALASIINAACGSVGYMLLMTGHQKVSFLNSIASVVLNVVLGILLIPHFGALGAAIGTALALALVNVMRYFQARILLKLHPYSLDTLKPVMAGLISASLTVALIWLMKDLHVFFQLLLLPVFLLSYTGCLFLFKISAEDMIVLEAFRKKFLPKRKK